VSRRLLVDLERRPNIEALEPAHRRGGNPGESGWRISGVHRSPQQSSEHNERELSPHWCHPLGHWPATATVRPGPPRLRVGLYGPPDGVADGTGIAEEKNEKGTHVADAFPEQ